MQSWPLPQDANKPSGTCSCCFAVRQLHLKDNTVHLHGPRSRRCPGSCKPPLSQPASNPLSATQTLQSSSHSPSLVDSTQQVPSTSTSHTSLFSHPSVNLPVIKHIPKSARPVCCTALSSVLHLISQSLQDLHASPFRHHLFDFGLNTLAEYRCKRGMN